jgi:hypothetical protein
VRVLLDEMLDRRLKRWLPEGVEAVTVRERGWDSRKNGELLALAEKEFDIFLTTDRASRTSRTSRVSTWRWWSFRPGATGSLTSNPGWKRSAG